MKQNHWSLHVACDWSDCKAQLLDHYVGHVVISVLFEQTYQFSNPEDYWCFLWNATFTGLKYWETLSFILETLPIAMTTYIWAIDIVSYMNTIGRLILFHIYMICTWAAPWPYPSCFRCFMWWLQNISNIFVTVAKIIYSAWTEFCLCGCFKPLNSTSDMTLIGWLKME